MAQSYKLFTGTIIGLGTSAQALGPDAPSIREVIVQAHPSNTTNVLVGNITEQFLVLVPGQGCSVPVNALITIYVKMASGTGTVNYLARD